jgi:hypothetical protein
MIYLTENITMIMNVMMMMATTAANVKSSTTPHTK